MCSDVCRQDSEGQQQASNALHEQLRWLESSFDSKRPFFLGEQFSLLDISLLPFFIRFPVLQHYRQFSLPQVRQLSLVHALLLKILWPYMCGLIVMLNAAGCLLRLHKHDTGCGCRALNVY